MDYVIAALLAAVLLLLAILLFRKPKDESKELKGDLKRLEDVISREFSVSRQENTNAAGKSREALDNAIGRFEQRISARMETVENKVEKKLADIQSDNSRQLDKINETVNEKLQKTLETRLGESFKSVSERLELVHKGLGEMQTLATGVGDLKKVLSNVKTRGILGEIQLENILEQILIPGQYEKNVATVPGKQERVEFAVKLPGKEDGNPVWMPVDSKFPLDKYQLLLEAYDTADSGAVDAATKELVASIKNSAKDIKIKYVSPPHTTDFGILFLPIEGLYAEVVKQPGLLEFLQQNYKINIAGPTTLAAMLNALQMGFKTLEIEQKSSKIREILIEAKKQFLMFEDVLETVQNNLKTADKNMEKLVSTRTRQIIRALDKVDALPDEEQEAHEKFLSYANAGEE